jgi:cytochrome b561
MTTPSPAHRYTAVAITLHWTISVSIIGMIFLGWYMGDLDKNSPLHEPVFALHKSIGLTILLLSVGRIVWRLINRPPPEPPMPGWQAGAAGFVHVAFYVLIIVMPLSGWLYSSLGRPGGTQLWGLPWADVPGAGSLASQTRRDLAPTIENVHSKLAWVIIVMLGLHIAGALKHQFIDKHGLLSRMLPGLFGRTAGPSARPRGGLYAAGAVALLLAGGLALGAMATSGPARAAPDPRQAQVAPASPSAAGQWKVDAAKSRIGWKGIYMGREFRGAFSDWVADIQFDPARPGATRVRVTIPVKTAKNTDAAGASQPYFDDSLKDVDWFNAAKFPTAVFEINGGVAAQGGAKYEATGLLSIKGVTYPVRLPFDLKIEGTTATMHGEVTLQRLALKIGGSTLAAGKTGPDDPEWVADDIAVTVDVVATTS